jgi:deoxyribodipyrimidine photolyase
VPADVPDPRALVWLKRDLRLHDHAPLAAALAHADALALFVIEREVGEPSTPAPQGELFD